MNATALMDLLSALAFLGAICVALCIPVERIGRAAKIFLCLAASLYALVGISNVLEHSGVTAALDVYEDHAEILFLPLMMYCLHALWTKEELDRRRRVEVALSASELQYRQLLEGAPDAIFVADLETGRIVDSNRRAGELIGIPRERIIGMRMADLHSPEDAASYAPEFRRLLAEGLEMRNEARVKRADGSLVWVEITCSIVEVGDKRLAQGIFHDISNRKKTEEILRENERFLQATFDGIQDGICVLDRNLTVVRVNSWLEKNFPDQLPLVGKKCYETFAGRHTICPSCPTIEVLKTGRLKREIVPYPSAAQPTRWFDLSAYPLKDADGAIVGVIEHRREATVQRQLEDQLRHSQKMEAVGQLAGGIAHDFNNQLTVIQGFAELLLTEPGHTPSSRARIGEILKASERSSLLVRQLLTFSRRQILNPAVVEIGEILRDLEPPLARIIGADIRLSIRAAGTLGPVNIDRVFFEQAIVNLTINSRDAMPRGGRLTIEAAEVTLGGDIVVPPAVVEPGSYVSIAVRDTGVGMDGATRARFFEPFFTTKEPGRGTGLGTSMVYGFVKQSGGHVTVESAPGAGTTVTIYLPRVEAAVAAPRREGPETLSPRGTETILVVEDEAAVRELVVHVLRAAGYRVIEAGSATEALEAAEATEERIDLVVTDLVMPDKNGAELARELRARYPGLLVLFMSGHPDRLAAAEGVHAEGSAFLSKPFTAQAVTQRVRALLDRRRAR